MSDLDRVTDRRAGFFPFSPPSLLLMPSCRQMSRRSILRAPRSGSDGGLCSLGPGVIGTASLDVLLTNRYFRGEGDRQLVIDPASR